MTTQQAKDSIGKPFKVTELHGGLLGSFDVIRSVSDDGIIEGDFIEAHAEDCRLKQDQPAHLQHPISHPAPQNENSPKSNATKDLSPLTLF